MLQLDIHPLVQVDAETYIWLPSGGQPRCCSWCAWSGQWWSGGRPRLHQVSESARISREAKPRKLRVTLQYGLKLLRSGNHLCEIVSGNVCNWEGDMKLPPRKPFFALPTTPKGEASVGFPVHLIHFQDKGQRHGIHDQIHLSQQVISLIG